MNPSKKSNWLPAIVFPMLLALLVSACGGGSDSIDPTPPQNSNFVPVSVSSGGGFGALNTLYVSITLCSPTDASNCQTIDNIMVDTGSVGLRVFNQPISGAPLSSLNLPQQTISGNPIAECMYFVQGNTWGPVKYAHLQIGGEVARNVAIQVINDPGFSSVPTACSDQNTMLDDVRTFRANGVLGLGVFPQDCGDNCTDINQQMDVYFSCSANGDNCINTAQSIGKQIQNPVTLFATNNNGIILTLDSVPDSGTNSVSGTLTFGVDTQNNNVSRNTNTIWLDNNPNNVTYGYFTTQIGGTFYPYSFLDTGSNGYFFNPPGVIPPTCQTYPGFYCPASTLIYNTTISGVAGSSSPVSVSVDIANAANLFSNQNNFVFDNIGGFSTSDAAFDWGLPFFYGKSVYIVIAGSSSTIGSGPYIGW